MRDRLDFTRYRRNLDHHAGHALLCDDAASWCPSGNGVEEPATRLLKVMAVLLVFPSVVISLSGSEALVVVPSDPGAALLVPQNSWSCFLRYKVRLRPSPTSGLMPTFEKPAIEFPPLSKLCR
jgi:hypothetical protein